MARYILLRVFLVLVNIWIVFTLIYFASNVASIQLWSSPHPLWEDIEFLWPQYTERIKEIVTRWNWGISKFEGDPVWGIFEVKAPISIRINLVAMVFYIPLGIGIGYISALNKDSLFDRFMGPITLILSSIPSFIIVTGLMYYLGYQLEMVPPLYPDQLTRGFWGAMGYFIPVVALSLGPIARFSRLTRGELLETFDSPYLLLVRTKGLTRRQSIMRHMARNTLVPVLPEITFTFVTVLGMSFLIEYIYQIPGVSNLLFSSIYIVTDDYNYIDIDANVLVLVGTFYVTMALIAGLVVDILIPIMDPRVKIGVKSQDIS